MQTSSILVDPLDALVQGPSAESVRVALAVPASGVLGATGPAVVAAAVLAAEEVNAAGGIGGRPLELVRFDAGRPCDVVAPEMSALLAAKAVVAVCGVHTSDVRQALEGVVAGRVPYLFTAPHEGGTTSPGVALVGARPFDQLLPVVRELVVQRGITRWAHIGNDYVWPQRVAPVANHLLHSHGASVLLAEAVPLGGVEQVLDRLLARLRSERVQAVLLTLVGRDLAQFNRAFQGTGLATSVLRVGLALDETGLLEIDGDDSGELYAAMPWFSGSAQAEGLQERYADRWGRDAPELGAYAAGCYDGVHLLSRIGSAGLLTVGRLSAGIQAFGEPAACELARADGLVFTSSR